MRFINSAAFQAFTTVVSLLASLLALGSFAFGVVDLKPGWGPLSKPGPVLTLLYLLMVIVSLMAGFAFLNMMKRRHQVGRGRIIDPTKNWTSTFSLLMYVVTVPLTVLWILAWLELMGAPKTELVRDDAGPLLMMIGGATIFFAGSVVAEVVLSIDWFFNSDHYTKDPTDLPPAQWIPPRSGDADTH